MDKLLHLFGVKDLTYDQLTPAERATFHSWLGNLKKNTLTINDVHEYIKQLRDTVETELTKTTITPRQDTFLKARLRNLMLIDAMMSLPMKAEELLRKQTDQNTP